MGSSIPIYGESIHNYRGVWAINSLTLRYIGKFYANSEDPDQTPRFAASNLGLHCLQKSI